LTVRLACLMHAASVYPEPGSNSPTKTSALRLTKSEGCFPLESLPDFLPLFNC
jgi:hypothetical protein